MATGVWVNIGLDNGSLPEPMLIIKLLIQDYSHISSGQSLVNLLLLFIKFSFICEGQLCRVRIVNCLRKTYNKGASNLTCDGKLCCVFCEFKVWWLIVPVCSIFFFFFCSNQHCAISDQVLTLKQPGYFIQTVILFYFLLHVLCSL